MARDDEPVDSLSDLPSFEDLVERAGGSAEPDDEGAESADDGSLPLDPSEYTVRELRQELDERDLGAAALRSIRTAEAEGQARKTAIEAVEDAIEEATGPPVEPANDLPDLEELASLGREGPADSGLSGPKASALLDLIDEAANVLVVGPEDSPVEHDLCAKLCTAGDRPRRRVLVTTIQGPDERLNTLRGYGAGAYDETAVIAVGDRVRSADRIDAGSLGAEGEDVRVERVTDASDLTRLGLLINKSLGGSDEEEAPMLCVHSLTAILHVVEVEKAFRFLHVLQGRVRSADTRAHYHLDPTALDDEVVNTIRPLFDFTVRFDDDGDLSVDT